METRVRGAGEMATFAREYVAALSHGLSAATVVAISGELGAGKTTFAQAAAAALGVEETVNSPTFVIEKIYELSGQKWQRLVHIDAYRLRGAEELRRLGWEELVAAPESLVIIEWPEHAEGAIPREARRVSIALGEGDERTITYDR